MICNNSFYSGSRHTCRPFPLYVQRLTAHGLSTDDHGSRAVDIMCNGSGSVQQYNAMTTAHTSRRSSCKHTDAGAMAQSSGSRAVDDHATDTMTGTAHMLRAVRGMYNGECFMFYVSRTGVQRHDQRHTRKRGAMPCVLSAPNGTSRMTTHKHTERLTDGKQTASHVTC